jgi:hypothetical protein
MTPWQLSVLMDAETDAQRMRYDLAVFTAWHVEAFARTKKLPDLGKLLARKSSLAPESAQDLATKIKTVMGMFPRAMKVDSG